MDILKKFNMSYSCYNTYLTSQLQFYFQYIKRPDPTDKGMQVYGDAGNVVHNAGEDYWKDKSNSFQHWWDDYGIDKQTGFRNSKLSIDKYRTMYNSLITYMHSIVCDESVAELKIEQEILGMNFKSYIDLYIELNGEIILYDWKTNSTHTRDMHKKQRLFYAWMIWKTKNKIPLCRWVYLKDMDVIEDYFTVQDLKMFEMDMRMFKTRILEKGEDISAYELGEYKNPFNTFYSLCVAEFEKRQETEDISIKLNIKGNYVFMEGNIPAKLLQGIDHRTKFDLPDKFHMQRAVRKKGGVFNLEDVGTVHLYNKKFKCFPIGLLEKVENICVEYAEYYKKIVHVSTIDSRDKAVMDCKSSLGPWDLISKLKIRDYQQDAIDMFIEKKHGIINIATGGGKTLVASDIIRRLECRVLWICDRKELLQQTKSVLFSYLGTTFKQIADGVVETGDHVIATVQSLNSKLPELQEYLKSVNFVIVDEFHKSAAETYQKVFAKLPNTKYRLGLTATVKRDDGKTPILHSLLGDVIYKVSTQDLIGMGYLVKPTIEFINLDPDLFSSGTYAEEYKEMIVENVKRNKIIRAYCWTHHKDKMIILTKSVEHGKELSKILKPGCGTIKNNEHLHGSVGKVKREQMMQDFRDNKFRILIMTLSIGAEGLDIPDLDVIINAAANKGDVKSIQVLGRVLRMFKNKNSAKYIDFIDSGKHTRKHSNARIKAFKDQGHEVIIK